MEAILFLIFIGASGLLAWSFFSGKGEKEVSASLLSSSIGKSLGSTNVLSATKKED